MIPDSEYMRLYSAGAAYLARDTYLQHFNGRLHLWHNGHKLATYPSDTLCRGDAVNRLREVWTWAQERLTESEVQS